MEIRKSVSFDDISGRSWSISKASILSLSKILKNRVIEFLGNCDRQVFYVTYNYDQTTYNSEDEFTKYFSANDKFDCIIIITFSDYLYGASILIDKDEDNLRNIKYRIQISANRKDMTPAETDDFLDDLKNQCIRLLTKPLSSKNEHSGNQRAPRKKKIFNLICKIVAFAAGIAGIITLVFEAISFFMR